MATTVTNKIASPASQYQTVKVTVDLDSVGSDYIKNLPLGTLCTAANSGVIGTVYSVDRYGCSFEILPVYDYNFYFYNTYKGVLKSEEDIDVDFDN